MRDFFGYIAALWRDTPGPIKTIVIAAVGAIIGAWLTSRASAKRRVIDELRAVRAAYALCQTITNKAFAVKRQHIGPMNERYRLAEQVFFAHQMNPRGPLNLELDLNTLSQVSFPGDRLLSTLFDKTSANIKCLTVAVQLHSSTEDLQASITGRNDVIGFFRDNTPPTHIEKLQFYFGLPAANHIIDLRLRNNLEALLHQVDDCIMFSMIVAEELLVHGTSLHRRNRFKFRLGMSKMMAGNWDEAYAANLVPLRENYADWDNKFIYLPTRWQRFKRAFRSGKLNDWVDL